MFSVAVAPCLFALIVVTDIQKEAKAFVYMEVALLDGYLMFVYSEAIASLCFQ